ncbi:MAG: pyridoxal-phosphate dependent enzyme [Melioribacteraceae bacterium]|nr:pyridoxal-phosphate dependent enzyme [Melioribacteraceae bacterium]
MKEPKKLSLANIPTPVQRIIYDGCRFMIKRDDFTGLELTGNKVRKLEYLLHHAKHNKYEYIFTSGGDQSNHARATCIAASMLGFKSRLFLWGDKRRKVDGNLFLDKLTGTEIEFLSKKDYLNVNEIMAEKSKLYSRKGKKAYVIPSGGSSPLGIWGYINFIRELNEQIDLKKTKGIVFANGSCGTSAGILLGSALLGININVIPVNVLMTKEEVYSETERLVNESISNYNLNVSVDFNSLEIMDGYSKEGYKSITRNKISLIKDFFKATGILLDPTYTGKAFFAYNEHFIKNRKTNNVLFLHTGGIYGTFAKKKNYLD